MTTESAPLSAPHRHDGSSIAGVMLRVAAALVPGLLAYIWFFGAGVLVQCLLAVVTAVAAEALLLKLRQLPPAVFLLDGSVMVTALLFALCISPLCPWWIAVTGVVFAVTAAKHLFGGIGCNLFNPAMAGYVFVLLCFPVQMNIWPATPGAAEHAPAIMEYLRAIFDGREGVDALSGATPLAQMQSQLGGMAMVSEIRTDPIYGSMAGRGWEWINAGFLVGGAALLLMRVISWHIPLAMLGTMFILSGVLHLYDADVFAPPLFHLFGGAAMLGAFFIATDPVTAPSSPRGRLIFGALAGALTVIIRTWGAFPDAVAFAVLICNGLAPLIDQFTRPRVLGEGLQ